MDVNFDMSVDTLVENGRLLPSTVSQVLGTAESDNFSIRAMAAAFTALHLQLQNDEVLVVVLRNGMNNEDIGAIRIIEHHTVLFNQVSRWNSGEFVVCEFHAVRM